LLIRKLFLSLPSQSYKEPTIMAIIIDFNAAKAKNDNGSQRKEPRTPEDVRRFMLGMDEPDEDLHVQMTFLNIDSNRTGLVGDFAAIEPLLDQLKGLPVQRRESIYDVDHNDRGPGVIMSVRQVVQLLDMMEEDGWTDLNPDVRILAEARLQALEERNKTYICKPKK